MAALARRPDATAPVREAPAGPCGTACRRSPSASRRGARAVRAVPRALGRAARGRHAQRADPACVDGGEWRPDAAGRDRRCRRLASASLGVAADGACAYAAELSLAPASLAVTAAGRHGASLAKCTAAVPPATSSTGSSATPADRLAPGEQREQRAHSASSIAAPSTSPVTPPMRRRARRPTTRATSAAAATASRPRRRAQASATTSAVASATARRSARRPPLTSAAPVPCSRA